MKKYIIMAILALCCFEGFIACKIAGINSKPEIIVNQDDELNYLTKLTNEAKEKINEINQNSSLDKSSKCMKIENVLSSLVLAVSACEKLPYSVKMHSLNQIETAMSSVQISCSQA